MSSKEQEEITKRNKERMLREWIYGQGDVLQNKKYLKDRNEFLSRHENGWWLEKNNKQQRRKK
jgi:hypothetical protein|tara:strand:- start:450 stop:638 length:189 start_codon:yes stop_codon:yes gene_type:complete